MRIAILGESDTDETILGSLIEAAGVGSLDLVSKPRLRSRGWPSVRDLTPSVIRHVHYRTDATGLVVSFDSNSSVVHAIDHESFAVDDCRTCDVRNVVATALATLRPVQGRPPVRVSVVTAVPAIEAWLLSVDGHEVSEAAWINGQRQGDYPYSRITLKERAYSTARPSRATIEAAASAFASRAAKDVAALSSAFPMGLGRPLAQIVGWADE